MSSEPAPPTKTQSVWTTAVNPWNCTEHAGRLPRFNPGTPLELALDQPDGIANTVAELLHRRPSSLPFRLDMADERLRYLFVVVAGYPEIDIGTMPHEEPLNPRATLALAWRWR